MNSNEIKKKFGDNYVVDERTFIMGIDQRFTEHFARRFKGLVVLETCTGAGFTTISLARSARHVFTIEIDQFIQQQAMKNIEKAGFLPNVTFLKGNALDEKILEIIPFVDAAFIDPDWAVTGPDHISHFKNSNTQPPADTLFNRILEITENIAIVLPPSIEIHEFNQLATHERERLYIEEKHELFCLYFGKLIQTNGETEFRV